MGAGSGKGFPTGIRGRPCAPRGARRRARLPSALSAHNPWHRRGSSGTRPLPAAPRTLGVPSRAGRVAWAVPGAPCQCTPALPLVSNGHKGVHLATAGPAGSRTHAVPRGRSTQPLSSGGYLRGSGQRFPPAAPRARCQANCESWSGQRSRRGEGEAARRAERAGKRGSARRPHSRPRWPQTPLLPSRPALPRVCTAMQPAASPGGGSRGAGRRGARGAASRAERRRSAHRRHRVSRTAERRRGRGRRRGRTRSGCPRARRSVRYLPSRPRRTPGGAAAGQPGPSPARGPQAEPGERRRRGEGAASRGAAALPAGGFSVSFRARAGTGLPGARRGRGRECAREGRCGRAWVWVCMCVCVFMGAVGACVRACVRGRGRGRASRGERASACASQCHIASSS